ncbi:arginine N-succinyltransferase [Glaciecola sp. MF2-115]|uniref:arginine N-succinyltransferase n=1 Tax=Glaciecola sp. MF2-115 TaxID=3384827 RepID=UPI0039A19E7C
MKIIRPIRASDYPSLYAIAQESGIGFTSLPVNEELLQNKISKAESAIQSTPTKPGVQSYLFVMEDTETGEVVGTSGIEATVGLQDAFYHYHISKVVHASRELNVHNTVELLHFCNDYTGVSEICTLFLRESARQGLNGRFLSKMRFLFMAEHKERFSDVVIAEMRGVSDEQGRSPFWAWLEEHFFSMDFPTADYMTGIGNKVFIAELMPKHPIYVNLLSKAAQDCIGKVHEKTRPALRLLEQEGFKCRGYVDIFDAGPTVEADVNNIATVQASRKASIVINDSLAQNDGETCFAINTSVKHFKACIADIAYVDGNRVAIERACADALGISDGDSIRFSPANTKH